jgi:two-component system cell cycle response regulator DivK
MRPATILIVEDNPMNRQLVGDLLELRGHRILTADSVAAAQTLFHSERLDLVLLDIHLGDGSGLDCLRILRSDSTLAKLPAIALTAFAMPGDRERFLRAGFDGYLSKPIDTRRFPEYIESFLKEP